ncbi:hypothetical protein ACP4OV_030269 [Aristida adscensionis]
MELPATSPIHATADGSYSTSDPTSPAAVDPCNHISHRLSMEHTAARSPLPALPMFAVAQERRRMSVDGRTLPARP